VGGLGVGEVAVRFLGLASEGRAGSYAGLGGPARPGRAARPARRGAAPGGVQAARWGTDRGRMVGRLLAIRAGAGRVGLGRAAARRGRAGERVLVRGCLVDV
jgi:hypothetical protein